MRLCNGEIMQKGDVQNELGAGVYRALALTGAYVIW
jgi:hypothetical protein